LGNKDVERRLKSLDDEALKDEKNLNRFYPEEGSKGVHDVFE
jgi:hypothetical protein